MFVALSSIHKTVRQKGPLPKLSKVINRHSVLTSINKMFKDWKLHVYLGSQASQIRACFDEFSQGDITFKDLQSTETLQKLHKECHIQQCPPNSHMQMKEIYNEGSSKTNPNILKLFFSNWRMKAVFIG